MKVSVIVFLALAANMAMADQSDLGSQPVYEAGTLTINSLSLQDGQFSTGEPSKDLMVNVTVITGCQPTEEIVVLGSNALPAKGKASYQVLGASHMDKSGFAHCFAMGRANESYKIASFPAAAVPKQISVNGQSLKQ